jgi:hypothetical protein
MPKVFLDEQTDGGRLEFGTDGDYWFVYDGTNTRLELWAKDSDGSGTNAKVFMIEDDTDDLVVPTGNIVVSAGNIYQSVQTIGVNFHDMRVHDNPAALLPAAGANDDLGLVIGTQGTNAPSLQTADEGEAGAEQHHYATWNWVVPPSFQPGSTVTVKVRGGMLVVADQTATTAVDLQAWVTDYANGDLSVSTDLVATDPIIAINSTTFAEHSFVVDDDLTGHALVPGSVVQFKLRCTVDDNSTATANVTMVVDRINICISA